MRRLLIPLVAVLSVGCGAHAELLFTNVGAQRLADGRVEVTATVECNVVGVPDCADLTHHCITADWHSAEGLSTQSGQAITELPAEGRTVDMKGEYARLGAGDFTTEACNDRLLQPGETDTLRVTSAEPIPTDRRLVIRVTTTSHGGMAFELERILVSP